MNPHNAPPVVFPLERSPVLGWLSGALWLVGLLAIVGWIDHVEQVDWRMILAIFLLLGAGVAMRNGWRHSPVGQLAWNGESWRWESADFASDISELSLLVIADFQVALLCRLETQNKSGLWLWAEKSVMPERWMDLRRAVYSPHRSSHSTRPDNLLPEDSAHVATRGRTGVLRADTRPTKP